MTQVANENNEAGKPLSKEVAPVPVGWKNRTLKQIRDDLLKVFKKGNKPPKLFQQGDQIVRIRSSGHGVRSEPLTLDSLRHHMDEQAKFVSSSRHEDEEESKDRKASKARIHVCPPPLDVVRDIMAMPGWPTDVFPPLERITLCPFFDRQGKLINTQGYHEGSKVWYEPDTAVEIPSVPLRPTKQDVGRATSILVDYLSDFPFEGMSDMANALGYMLTPFARELITSPIPMLILDAPTPGTGKGLLAKALTIPVLGRPLPITPQPENEAEWRKVITSQLTTLPQFVLFDNLTGTLRSNALEAVLTTDPDEFWSDRELGSTNMLVVPVRCVWLATANNLQISGDLSRRLVWVRLDAKCERPEERAAESFKHPELLRWAKENRGSLVWALLVLIQNWVNEGQPLANVALGSFDSWAKTVGGILQAAGINRFLENAAERRETTDDEVIEWRAVCNAWWLEHEDDEIGVKELYQLVEKDELLPWLLSVDTEVGRRQRLGHKLRKLRGRCFGAFRITQDGSDNSRRRQYHLELLPGHEAPPPEEQDEAEPAETGDPNRFNHLIESEDLDA